MGPAAVPESDAARERQLTADDAGLEKQATIQDTFISLSIQMRFRRCGHEVRWSFRLAQSINCT